VKGKSGKGKAVVNEGGEGVNGRVGDGFIAIDDGDDEDKDENAGRRLSFSAVERGSTSTRKGKERVRGTSFSKRQRGDDALRLAHSDDDGLLASRPGKRKTVVGDLHIAGGGDGGGGTSALPRKRRKTDASDRIPVEVNGHSQHKDAPTAKMPSRSSARLTSLVRIFRFL
jgi:hypothetical protein